MICNPQRDGYKKSTPLVLLNGVGISTSITVKHTNGTGTRTETGSFRSFLFVKIISKALGDAAAVRVCLLTGWLARRRRRRCRIEQARTR